jgi:hypothetical protein
MNRFAMPIIVVSLAGIYSLVATLVLHTPFISVLLVNTLTFALFFTNVKLFKDRKKAYTYIITTLVLLVLLILNAKYKVPFMAGVDWANYDAFARSAIDNSQGIFDLFSNSIDSFVFLIAIIYKVFGSNVEQLYFYIFPFALLLFRYTYKTVYLLTSKYNMADKAMLIMALWPVDIIFSIALLREIPIQFLVILSFYHFIRYYEDRKRFSLSLAMMSIIFTTLMHSGMISIFVVYLYVLLQKKFYSHLKFIRIGGIILVSILVVLISFTPLWDSMSKRFTSLNSSTSAVTAIENQNKYLGEAATNYITSVPQDVVGIILSIPYRFIMFALSPMPWQVINSGTLLSFLIDGLLQIYVLFMVIKIYKKRKSHSTKDRDIITLIIMCILSTYLIFSLGTSNYGTAMRHRAKVAPLVVVLISVYGARRQEAKT